ncbi:MAG: gas vesicle protein K [Actinomycetota bacterium]|nr:gas vesicle protein K [Actinomycetota bacterium]
MSQRGKVLYGDPDDLHEMGLVDLGQLIGEADLARPARIDLSSQNVERGLAQLVVGVVEVLRQVLERQAVRRMEAGALDEGQVERLGNALMALEERVGELCDALARPSDPESGGSPQDGPSATDSELYIEKLRGTVGVAQHDNRQEAS